MIATLILAFLIGGRPPALSPEEFRAELDRIAQQIRSTASASQAPALSSAIPARWRVAVGDREELEINSRWLTVTLDAAPANSATWLEVREALGRRLDRMRDEIALDRGGDGGARVRARTSAQAILSRSEYQQGAVSRWREDLRDRIADWLTSLLTRLGINGEAGARTVTVLAWVIGLSALTGLGVWLTRTMTQRPRHLLDLGSGNAPKPRAHDLATQALAHARAGNLREAVRIAYHAALVRLEEQGVWRTDAARTPREYMRILAADDVRRVPLLDMTRRFEQICYGNRAAGEDDAASVTSHLEVLGCLRPGERAI